MMQTNCYIAYGEKEQGAFVVDPGDEARRIYDVACNEGVSIEAILITHGHFDHIGGISELKKLSGAKIYMHKSDVEKIDDMNKNFSWFVGRNTVAHFEPDVLLSGGEELDLCGMKIKVMATPGHSDGEICYIANDSIFCGDAVFRESFGRYDNYDGSLAKTVESFRKIFALQGDYTMYCGHGEDTTLSYEKQNNEINKLL